LVTASGSGDVVSRARTGDEDAWAVLYRAHAGRLLTWLLTTTRGDRALAEDLAAEAWFTAARRIGDFRGDEDGFAGWLFGIARKLAQNERRTRTRRATSPHPTGADDGMVWGAVEDAVGLVDGADLARRLLATLPQREAEVIACVDVVGLDVRSTAAALGISQVAVRVARHRGLGKLRAVLAQAEGGATTAPPLDLTKPDLPGM
jgi:RNA polymerase sigma-70 factor (ECF subfamily)